MTRAGETALPDLFDAAGVSAGDEVVSRLAEVAGVRIERIVSPPGHESPAGFWFEQHWPEWVAVLAGEACLLFEGDPEPRRLPAGSSLLIAAGRRHRIAWTDPSGPTIWLAVHLPPGRDA